MQFRREQAPARAFLKAEACPISLFRFRLRAGSQFRHRCIVGNALEALMVVLLAWKILPN